MYITPVSQVETGVAHLHRILVAEHIGLAVCPGAEVHTAEGFVAQVLDGRAGTLNHNGRYVLVEFPFRSIYPGVAEALQQLVAAGVTPVIAHPERNGVLQRNLDVAYDLVEMGCLMQITAMSITGEMGEKARRCAHSLLERGLAHIIASDSHSPQWRPPVLSQGVAAAAAILESKSEAEAMVTSVPAAIINGEAFEIPDPRLPRDLQKKWWQVF